MNTRTVTLASRKFIPAHKKGGSVTRNAHTKYESFALCCVEVTTNHKAFKIVGLLQVCDLAFLTHISHSCMHVENMKAVC